MAPEAKSVDVGATVGALRRCRRPTGREGKADTGVSSGSRSRPRTQWARRSSRATWSVRRAAKAARCEDANAVNGGAMTSDEDVGNRHA